MIEISDVKIIRLDRYTDHRGWLTELFRVDELPEGFSPEMAYLSITRPGQIRGPHEHKYQTDYFCMIGPSDFEVHLWDNRSDSPTYKNYKSLVAGQSQPSAIMIPPGIVHGYKNIGPEDGMVVNCPNRLYAGQNKSEPVDEIRYERSGHEIFRID